MKTSELVKAVAMETGLTVSATEKAVNAVFSAIKKEVGAGGEVKVFKFGTFSVAELGEREGRDPRTGVSVVIPARRRCMYHQSITFKRELNGNGEEKG